MSTEKHSIEELVAAIVRASAGGSSANTVASQIGEILPMIFKEVDDGLEIFDEVVQHYLPEVKDRLECLSDYMLDRKIKAIKKLKAETGLDAEQAAHFLIQSSQLQSDAFYRGLSFK